MEIEDRALASDKFWLHNKRLKIKIEDPQNITVTMLSNDENA